MQIRENISLKPYHTFGIDVKAKAIGVFKTSEELAELLQIPKYKSQIPKLVLGGGSNILFTQNFEGVVLKNEITGIEISYEDEENFYLKVGAGENWHNLVMHCVGNNYAGLENLSLIPGNVGASPMQNIGAYGVEIKDVFHELEALHISDATVKTFSKNECEFGYRESVFKRNLKGQFIITSVTYRLNKNPTFNTSYGAIQQELERMGVKELNIKAISQAVINIRSSKLPDPKEIGNAGSFFKNPTISNHEFHELKLIFPGIVGFPAGENYTKLAAGWLIEQCGWKGFRKGDAGCYSKQALVLVNYGNASGTEIFELSAAIIKSVQSKFGVELEREVNVI